MIRSFKTLFSILFFLAFFVMYGLVPLLFVDNNFSTYVNTMVVISILCTTTLIVVLNFPVIISARLKYPRLRLTFQSTLFFFFCIFLFFNILIIATAPTIPIIESLKGASPQDLDKAREDFLKGRTGIESALAYIIGIINTTFIPYLIALGYVIKYKYRHIFATIFFLVSLVSLEKAYFLKIAIPLFIVFFYQAKNKKMLVIKAFFVTIACFMLMYLATGFSQRDTTTSDELFFSIGYGGSNPLEAMVWRSTVVPVITAFDGVRVFTTDFNSQLLWGRTSTLFAALMGEERINFERHLYQEQFGGSGLGNANQFYGIEAYINFGYFGVVLFSMIIGYIVRESIMTKDVALISIILLLIYNLFNSGLIGNLFSNGYLFFLFFIAFVKIK
ncbi:MAG: oligosaccharide repeat unit polymerase [Leadbetterella sp.]|nr:oligosaccharide repeat unit polymerase [Leadbetterella sp.]